MNNIYLKPGSQSILTNHQIQIGAGGPQNLHGVDVHFVEKNKAAISQLWVDLRGEKIPLSVQVLQE